MPHIHNGIEWFVKGIDSWRPHEGSDGQFDGIWCKHTEQSEYEEAEKGFIMCSRCGRRFSIVHPVTAESIIRDKDTEIRYWMVRFNEL